MTNIELYNILLSRNPNIQIIVAIEELSELQKELTKKLRGLNCNVLEEYVDVLIIMEQLKILFNFNDSEIENMKDYKLRRLENRIKNDSL